MPRAATNSDIYNAIAEPRRREILILLAPSERAVGDIANSLEPDQPSVSKHLRVLRETGLVHMRYQGREKFYRTHAAALRPLHEWTAFFEKYWTHQLDRIRQRAEAAAVNPDQQMQKKTGEANDSSHPRKHQRCNHHHYAGDTRESPITITFAALLEQLGPGNEQPNGTLMPMKLEAFPGGRWFRDLGNNNGHFWGNVQAIKSPSLLEISGPLFMSAPVSNNIQYRLTEDDGETIIHFRHTGFGLVPKDMVAHIHTGWAYMSEQARKRAEATSAYAT